MISALSDSSFRSRLHRAPARPGSRVQSRHALRSALAVALIAVAFGCRDEGATAEERAPATDPLIAAIDASIQQRAIDKSQPQWRVSLKVPPKFTFDASKKYFWKLQTNQGVIVFRMFPETAPIHVGSTFYLTRLGFYDSLGFHRVIKGFMAQGGDPLGTGTGSPGFRYYGEFDPKVGHDGPGVLSMANAGPGTDGSQFFITFSATPHLNGLHTVFGKAESEESLATIRKLDSLAGPPNGASRPKTPIVIERASILIE